MRSLIGGYNGYVKDGGLEALDDPERHRIHRLVARSVFVAFLPMVADPRKLLAFMEEAAAIGRHAQSSSAAASHPIDRHVATDVTGRRVDLDPTDG